jgi:hypothetical protein
VSDNTSKIDPNAHVAAYLQHYMSLPDAPGYAVLIKGPWGIGKTFLIERILDEHFCQRSNVAAIGMDRGGVMAKAAIKASPFKLPWTANRFDPVETNATPLATRADRYLYVSLYGLKNAQEIDDAIFRALYPAFGWKPVRAAGRIANIVMGAFDPPTDFSPQAFLEAYNVDLYVFDDLERCEMPIEASLGYINEFVEHAGAKVIIIANEDDIDEARYATVREKVIGKSLVMMSAFNEAVDHFISQLLDHQTRTYLEKHRALIAEICRLSQQDNLRILQRTIWDFSRIYEALAPHHKKNEKAVGTILKLVFAWSMEVRSGRLTPADLANRAARLSVGKEAESTAMAHAAERYGEIDLADTILPNQILMDALENGVVNAEAIQAYLDATPYFVDPTQQPAWRIVWYASKFSDEEFESALNEMETQYAARAFTDTGILQHVVGLRLAMAEIGAVATTRAEVIEDAKRYADALLAANNLEPLGEHTSDGIDDHGYAGLQIQEARSDDMKEFRAYVRERRRTAAIRQYPALASALLAEMKADPDLFARRVRANDGGEDAIYTQVPLLQALPPEEFVEALMGLHPIDQGVVLRALKSRYQHGMLGEALAAEKPWLVQVHAFIIAAAAKLKPYPKSRIVASLYTSITPLIK